ncbi:calcineurin-like phosphoesterase family protein [Catalinimonas niigatensis]|uniref:calcineurin-like phosphoesterase family protein n=1 Tax=Catalinimonas niigatensis TaxID=1397264 RepID=UPI0026669DC1|nr:calcineurin-like phosphoesterase family protein [Catalinimonas niigatensis]WPP49601.1 calcineurin-like phosphoesterase family protein [Catalinimonas niigatensis]
MRPLIFSFLLLFVVTFSQAQQQVKGIVYEDLNENGKKERREPGIAGVSVSNGQEVVVTDEEGRYVLPVDNDDIIFVIKPSGYEIPVNALNLPQFYYIHKPEGSPQMDYKGVEPTGKLPKSVDFALLPAEESENFTGLFFGDPQPYTREEVAFFDKDVVEEVVGIENIPFGLSLGDLVGDDLDLFHPYNEAISRVGIPWWNVYGNHDMNYDAAEDTLADETFEATYGPANYAFNYGKVHFIVLDDVMYPDPRDGQGYWGGFREDMFTFMENDLKQVPKDHLIVISFHIPLFDASADNDTFKDEDRERFFQLLKDYPYTLSLSAHTHLQRHDFFTKAEGWTRDTPHHHYNVGTTSGDWYSGTLNKKGVPNSTMRDGTPKGYAFISFKGNQYEVDYKVVGEDEDYRMRIFTPKVVPHEDRTSAGIYVNFFQGSEKAKLRYRVDEGSWKEMNYTVEVDPVYLGMLHEWDYTEELMPGRRPSNAVPSRHLWRAAIPTDLTVGTHTIEVEATDMFGRKFTESTTYNIAEPAQAEIEESEE